MLLSIKFIPNASVIQTSINEYIDVIFCCWHALRISLGSYAKSTQSLITEIFMVITAIVLFLAYHSCCLYRTKK